MIRWRRFSRGTMIAGALAGALGLLLLTPTQFQRRHLGTCGAALPDPLVDQSVDRSITAIFGVGTFLSAAEWSQALPRLRAGAPFIQHVPGGLDTAIFMEPSPADVSHSPMLIKVIGQGLTEDVMTHPRRGLWLVDYCGNGEIDRIVQYRDRDEDPDVLYYAGMAYAQPGIIMTTAPLATTDFQYIQDLDQWRSQFGAGTFIAMFNYSYALDALVPFNEAPFCFYDRNRDGHAEAAVRLEIPLQYSWLRSRFLVARSLFERVGYGRDVTTARYSLNLDEPRDWGTPFHYNFSVSGVGELSVPAGAAAGMRVGRALSEPLVQCGAARAAVEGTDWAGGVALTWKEDDLNHAENDKQQRDRWEGVINRGSEAFPQVGGPAARRFNTRMEVAPGPRKMQTYFSDVDRRIHLLGARTSIVDVDFDDDQKLDMRIGANDASGDGVLDTWQVDADGDGTWDRTFTGEQPAATPLGWDEAAMAASYRSRRESAIAEYEAAIAAIKVARSSDEPAPAERYFSEKLQADDRIGRRLRVSDEARRFFLNVALEQHFHRLRQDLEARRVSEGDRAELSRLFGAGLYGQFIAKLQKR
jgi:hypothetical protein